jgi:hypothetical protein
MDKHALCACLSKSSVKQNRKDVDYEGMSGVISYLFLTPVHCNLESLDRAKSTVLKMTIVGIMCADLEKDSRPALWCICGSFQRLV